jgi:hypothetical protein
MRGAGVDPVLDPGVLDGLKCRNRGVSGPEHSGPTADLICWRNIGVVVRCSASPIAVIASGVDG